MRSPRRSQKLLTANSRSVTPVLTYVANAIRIGDREIPYSTVTGIDLALQIGSRRQNKWSRPPDLAESVGGGRSERESRRRRHARVFPVVGRRRPRRTSSAKFQCAGVLPMNGIGGDADADAGLSRASAMPPTSRRGIRRSRSISSASGRKTKTTGINTAPRRRRSSRSAMRNGSGDRDTARCRRSGSPARSRSARKQIDPAAAGFTARNVRAEAINAAQGTTDFGEYFLYFSFFLVVSALLLAYLFFAVGLEQRTTEVGVLAAMGFSSSKIRGVFVREGAILAGDRRGDRDRGRDRLQRADPVRTAHVVGRRGRHHRSHTACRAAVARRSA